MFLNKNFFKSKSLFVKVASITLISILLVTICISTISITISKNILADSFSKSNYKVLSQISDNFNELNDKIITTMNAISNSTDFQTYLTHTSMTSQKRFKTIYNINKVLKDSISTKEENKITICVVGKNKETYINNNDVLLLSADEILNDDITQKALESPNQIFYQFINNGYINSLSHSSGLVAIKVLKNIYTKEIYGFVYAFISQKFIQDYYYSFINNGIDISILSQDGTIVSSSNFSKIGTTDTSLLKISNTILDNKYTYFNTKINSHDTAVLSKFLRTYNFNLIGMIDQDIAINEIFDTWQIIFVSIFIALIFIVLLFFIIRRTTRPISTLANTMVKIVNGDFNNHISIDGGSEVQELCDAFNFMLDGLNKYINSQMEIQKEKRKAEIHALQMQINPHFIYNTLSSIKWLVWQDNIEKSSETIDAFISLLQNTISNKHEMITIAQEIENLKHYVLINHVRYGDKVTVNYFVMNDCTEYIVPKLILQPFIENSFFHAFTDKDSGYINVLVNKNNDNLICEIIDNGCGMDSECLRTLFKETPSKSKSHFTSIGINNVNDRIKLLYGETYGVTITSDLNYGTNVKIIIPALKEYKNYSK